MSFLEHRYRRLISLYPAAHRRRYEMEMLSTLMDGAAENQRAPRLRETTDLVWNAIWLRLNPDGGRPVRDPRWAQAAAIVGTLGAMVIAGLHVMGPLGEVGWRFRLAAMEPLLEEISWIPFAQGAAWLAVAVTALLGWQRIAAIVGWATVLLTLAWALGEYRADPAVLVAEWTLIVLGVVVAGCLTLAKGPLVLRAWQVAVFAGASAACMVSVWIDAMMAVVHIYPDRASAMIGRWGMGFPTLPGIDFGGAPTTILLVVAMLVTVWIQYRVDAGVRRRVRAYAWVVVATFALVRTTFTDPVQAPLSAGQWAALILVPLVTFGIGVIVVRRKDSKQRLIEIGRAHP